MDTVTKTSAEGLQTVLQMCYSTIHIYTYFLPRVYMFRSRAHFKKQRKWGSTFPEREHSYKHKQGKSQVTITNKCYQYIFAILLTAGGDANLVELGII